MPRTLRLAYLAHAISSDWANGDAHFLRGLLRGLVTDGHKVIAWEPSDGWSVEHLLAEPGGENALRQFRSTYPDLDVHSYVGSLATDPTADGKSDELWEPHLRNLDVVILHEWNPPALAQRLLRLRSRCGYRLLFHDTHHRQADTLEDFSLKEFDGVLVSSDALLGIYREGLGLDHVWTLHEAADTTVFHPHHEIEPGRRLVWIGNWGREGRSEEFRELLLEPAAALRDSVGTTVRGVGFPAELEREMQAAGVTVGGYLPNLSAPLLYAASAATMHLPSPPYATARQGIPSMRVFEALACGIPLVSTPFAGSDQLFRPGDLVWASTTAEMIAQLEGILAQPRMAQELALAGMETVLSRHTCHHRAQELAAICDQVLAR